MPGIMGCLPLKNPPPLQGEAHSGRVPAQNADAFFVGPGGRVGEGVSDIVHELKFLFFNSFAAFTPTPLSLRELSQSQRERGLFC